MTQRLRDFGLSCGIMQPGPLNAITDVPGVKLGHRTLRDGDILTGFTALLPHDGSLFRRKVRAAVDVINGFGKSAGLMQLAELGQIETPLLLCNTLAVGTGFDALVARALADNPDIGRETGTVNPVVLECNDGYLSDIRARALTEEHAFAALDAATAGPVAEGAVGAGTGMSAFGFKGGIGTASRGFDLDGKGHVLGVLALANFGNAGDLVLPDGRHPTPRKVPPQSERGSVILIIATDVPMESRQLHRVARRGGAGLARLGAFWGNGSGDIAVAFTTADPIDHDQPSDLVPLRALNESRIDTLFRAAAEATQEAVLNAMVAAPATTGRDGHHRPSLGDWLRANAG
ncbi:P1 family peptidase [Hyphomicrobiales bacterium]|nr:P1 family peptidase [Hyphomicrobiales bacterium]CAH1698452.1 P1 family peptidase [Hyphomicrobiales bacterium]CAI0342102.1 D-aminopeptidase [Hyphomicrobiales bacterium]